MSRFKRFAAAVAARGNQLAIAAGALVVAGPSMAADATFDTSSPTAMIAGGAAACGIIGSAWVGLKYLVKVWQRV